MKCFPMKCLPMTCLQSKSTALALAFTVAACSSTSTSPNPSGSGGSGTGGTRTGNGDALGAGGLAQGGGGGTGGTGGSDAGSISGKGGASTGGAAGAGRGGSGAGGEATGGAGGSSRLDAAATGDARPDVSMQDLRPAGGAGGSAVDGASGSGGIDGATGPITGPCDLYAAGNTPCVAAHSSVRALFGAYGGNLYQVKRASDSKTKDIPALAPGGFADSAAQDAFCTGTTCTISILYDQSGKGNHLTSAPGGGHVKTADKEVTASKLKLSVGGHTVYGAYFEGGMGYRNNKTSGVATGDQPESMYMVTSGKHYNAECCFDYGNAETSNNDDGNGTMEAVYFGNSTGWGKGAGNGPWVMADLENGLFGGQTFSANASNTPLTSDYVTAMIKGKAGGFALKGGDAQTGKLKTMYEGGRPANGYDPMKKQGAIILGIGGDNSNTAIGTFLEGVMTAGYASDAVDDAVQANIVAAGYGH
jgi:non-reducing end alpha-L-arabinofuranosidase